MNCRLEKRGDAWVCPRCHRRIVTQIESPNFAPMTCGVGDCLHLGPETRRVGCESCGGNVQVKVFACEVYGEATIAKQLQGVECHVECCATCESYSSGK